MLHYGPYDVEHRAGCNSAVLCSSRAGVPDLQAILLPVTQPTPPPSPVVLGLSINGAEIAKDAFDMIHIMIESDSARHDAVRSKLEPAWQRKLWLQRFQEKWKSLGRPLDPITQHNLAISNYTQALDLPVGSSCITHTEQPACYLQLPDMPSSPPYPEGILVRLQWDLTQV